jgi:hypothetical protein
MPLIMFVSSSSNTYVNLPKKKDNDSDFAEIYNACGHSTFGKFYLMDGYLFKENRLCVRLDS